jgi:site-specific DNA-cytosine methylase
MLGINVKVAAVADRKKLAQKFTQWHGAGRIDHFFELNEGLIRGGKCILHGPGDCCRPEQTPHIVTAGLPCQPYTGARFKGLDCSSRRGPAEGHPDFGSVDEFIEYLEVRQPHMFFVEEVKAFNQGAVSYMVKFTKRCARLGYSVRALQLNHNEWVNFPRDRTSANITAIVCSSREQATICQLRFYC